MRSGFQQFESRPLRAPREDRGLLMAPASDRVGEIVSTNRQVRAAWEYDFQGRSLAELSQQARQELVVEARQWVSAYRDVGPERVAGATDVDQPIFLAGHQPQLFHPGVWLKNLALGALAEAHGAVAINLIIDNDTIKAPSLRVPGGTIERPHSELIPFDSAGRPIPFEERRVLDRQILIEFGRRARRQIAPLVPEPLVRQYWPMVIERFRQTDNLGACLAQSRHQLEGQWGWKTLEIPQSRICQTESHGWFVSHLVAQLPRFREVYNAVVGEYRRARRIRSAAHPVPDLGHHGPWLEAPFWIWTIDDPRRRPLWVRHRPHDVLLSDRHGLEVTLPLRTDGQADRAVQRLMELAQEGVKIRSRALITTLWARIALGDLFIHGIGGAKYDQVTDALFERFFGLQPPLYMVLSATLHLPLPKQPHVGEDPRLIRHRLRELTFHPECSINGVFAGGGDSADGQRMNFVGKSLETSDQDPGELIAEKIRWIRTPRTAENASIRHQEIRRINQALQPWVAGRREQLLEQFDRAAQATGFRSTLSWREYGFCLHPERTLRDFFDELLSKIAQIGFDKAKRGL